MNTFFELNNKRDVPLRRSRDTDEIGFEEGLVMLHYFIGFNTTSSILFDYNLLNEKDAILAARKSQTKNEEKSAETKDIQLTPNKPTKPLNSSSPAYSPPSANSKNSPVVAQPEINPEHEIKKRLLSTYRPVDIPESPSKSSVKIKMSNRRLFSYGYYSESCFFGLYNG